MVRVTSSTKKAKKGKWREIMLSCFAFLDLISCLARFGCIGVGVDVPGVLADLEAARDSALTKHVRRMIMMRVKPR